MGWTPGLATVLAVCVAGCATDAICTAGESRPCACPGGASGTQICGDDGAPGECVCTPTEDASVPIDGGRPDASRDASMLDAGRVDASAPPDAFTRDASSRDAGRDAAVADAGVDARADAPTWECSVVPQSGCPVGYACRLSIVTTSCGPGCTTSRTPGNGPPECVPAGIRSPETTCAGAIADDCQAGLFCFSTCRRYCDPGGPACPSVDGSPQRCNADPGSLLDPNPLGLGFCEPDL